MLWLGCGIWKKGVTGAVQSCWGTTPIGDLQFIEPKIVEEHPPKNFPLFLHNEDVWFKFPYNGKQYEKVEWPLENKDLKQRLDKLRTN